MPTGVGSCPVGVLGLGVIGAAVEGDWPRMAFWFPVGARSNKTIDGVTCFSGNEGLPAFLHDLRVLINLLPLTPQTTNILDEKLFAMLPKGAFVVNIGRGAHLVDPTCWQQSIPAIWGVPRSTYSVKSHCRPDIRSGCIRASRSRRIVRGPVIRTARQKWWRRTSGAPSAATRC